MFESFQSQARLFVDEINALQDMYPGFDIKSCHLYGREVLDPNKTFEVTSATTSYLNDLSFEIQTVIIATKVPKITTEHELVSFFQHLIYLVRKHNGSIEYSKVLKEPPNSILVKITFGGMSHFPLKNGRPTKFFSKD